MADLVTVKVFPTRLEAEMACELLDEQGIPALVSTDGAVWPFNFEFGAEVRVREEDVALAQQVLAQMDAE
jgi:hypothetical protein